MTSDGDPKGLIDSIFMLVTLLFTVLIIFIALCGCCTGYLKHKCCLGCFGLLGLGIMIFLFFVGSIFIALKSIGDGLCEIVTDPAKMAAVPSN